MRPTMKKWPLLAATPGTLGRLPRIAGTRLSTEHVYRWCAGSDSEQHIKDFRKEWNYVTPEAIRMAIAFERAQRKIS